MSVAAFFYRLNLVLHPLFERRAIRLALYVLLVISSAFDVQAAADVHGVQSTPDQAVAVADAAAGDVTSLRSELERQAPTGEPRDRPLRGVSMQAHVGGGYTVFDRKITDLQTFPQLRGRRELLGAGPAVDVSLGVDLSSWLSLQVLGGMTFLGARRADYVHSFGQSYAAIGVRFAVPLKERWHVNLAPGIGYFRQDNAVDKPQNGVGLLGQLGVEYDAHVRHFSIGADLSVQAPLAPTRVFVGVSPHVRYTF